MKQSIKDLISFLLKFLHNAILFFIDNKGIRSFLKSPIFFTIDKLIDLLLRLCLFLFLMGFSWDGGLLGDAGRVHGLDPVLIEENKEDKKDDEIVEVVEVDPNNQMHEFELH